MFISLTPDAVGQSMEILHGWAVEEDHVWNLPAHMSPACLTSWQLSTHVIPITHRLRVNYSDCRVFPSSPISCFLLSLVGRLIDECVDTCKVSLTTSLSLGVSPVSLPLCHHDVIPAARVSPVSLPLCHHDVIPAARVSPVSLPLCHHDVIPAARVSLVRL
jgi:hypothetical protein